MFIGATIVHVLVLGSYRSTELSELWAAPGRRRKSYFFVENVSSPRTEFPIEIYAVTAGDALVVSRNKCLVSVDKVIWPP